MREFEALRPVRAALRSWAYNNAEQADEKIADARKAVESVPVEHRQAAEELIEGVEANLIYFRRLIERYELVLTDALK